MTVLDLLALLLGIWIGRRITRAGPALHHARNELTITRGQRDHARYLLELSRDQQAEHLAICPLANQQKDDAA